MKKFIPIFIVALIFAILLPVAVTLTATVAKADYTEYARIITEDTPFYADKHGEDLLFYLPYTYYVRVISDDGEFSHVECYAGKNMVAIDGYVPSSMLFYDGQSVKNPYASVTITAGYTALLYESVSLQNSLQYIFEGRKMNFYGSIQLPSGQQLYFVSYNDKLGYVKEESILPFTLPNHPNELTFLKPEEPEIPVDSIPSDDDLNTDGDSTDLTLRILIISCLIFAGIIALIIAFKKKPIHHTSTGYYDENDYE